MKKNKLIYTVFIEDFNNEVYKDILKRYKNKYKEIQIKFISKTVIDTMLEDYHATNRPYQ